MNIKNLFLSLPFIGLINNIKALEPPSFFKQNNPALEANITPNVKLAVQTTINLMKALINDKTPDTTNINENVISKKELEVMEENLEYHSNNPTAIANILKNYMFSLGAKTNGWNEKKDAISLHEKHKIEKDLESVVFNAIIILESTIKESKQSENTNVQEAVQNFAKNLRKSSIEEALNLTSNLINSIPKNNLPEATQELLKKYQKNINESTKENTNKESNICINFTVSQIYALNQTLTNNINNKSELMLKIALNQFIYHEARLHLKEKEGSEKYQLCGIYFSNMAMTFLIFLLAEITFTLLVTKLINLPHVYHEVLHLKTQFNTFINTSEPVLRILKSACVAVAGSVCE